MSKRAQEFDARVLAALIRQRDELQAQADLLPASDPKRHEMAATLRRHADQIERVKASISA